MSVCVCVVGLCGKELVLASTALLVVNDMDSCISDHIIINICIYCINVAHTGVVFMRKKKTWAIV